MIDGVQVRRAEDYFEEYGRQRICEQKLDRLFVKKELIDAFHKEIFSIVAMRAKKRFSDIPKEGDPEAIRIARNVVKDATKKWIKVCKMFESNPATRGLIRPEDISVIPENDEIGFDNGELVTREVPVASDSRAGNMTINEDGVLS